MLSSMCGNSSDNDPDSSLSNLDIERQVISSKNCYRESHRSIAALGFLTGSNRP